jgi:hypothetical protein
MLRGRPSLRLRKKREIPERSEAVSSRKSRQPSITRKSADRTGPHELQSLARHQAEPDDTESQPSADRRHGPWKGAHQQSQTTALAHHHGDEGPQRKAVQPEGSRRRCLSTKKQAMGDRDERLHR